ncbi:PilZ domain-containing protein [Aliidiomarina sp. Khilg15.8]
MSEISLSALMHSVPVDIEIKFGAHAQRIRGIWVGQREGEYLVLEIPRKYNWLETQEWFSDSISVVIRGVNSQGQAFAALTRFIGTSARPYRTVYVTVPDQLQERSLRRVPRMPVDIEARLSFAEEVETPEWVEKDFTGWLGRAMDLSRTGIGFETEFQLPCPPSSMLNQLVELHMYDNGNEIINVLGEIKSCRQPDDKLTCFGVAIDSRNREYQAALKDLILASKTIKAVIHGD